ncbi:hypothetical protein NP233_g4638 [Leucocoprinus birnbaumii]|uniref:Uncharacterized protein n=1 Tax=Leucocoprinus birnbaumii TaxID=56174 RepID=A0AAD5VX10_9AGAR|nr:hypothetical protein NP233_g4638 [Leucocoprinus birnbaumii]
MQTSGCCSPLLPWLSPTTLPLYLLPDDLECDYAGLSTQGLRLSHGLRGVPPACQPGPGLKRPVKLARINLTNNRPLEERALISQNAIHEIATQLNNNTGQFSGIGYWQSGNVWTAMANQDRFAGTNINRAQVVEALNTVFEQQPNYNSGDDALWWAQAAIAGHRGYQDDNFLSHAVATWNFVSGYVITQAQANTQPKEKTSRLSGICDGSTMAGGVFWQSSRDNQDVNSITTGLYLTTSALLAEITGNSTYTNAAILSAQWI